MISFIYYFHSKRLENLKQTLRMLFKREKIIGEVILVCNDFTKESFENCKLYNMNLSSYEKPKMCNFGVSKASNDIVAILDSDRILPKGYFEEVCKKIKPGLFFSCDKIFNLEDYYTDQQIESGRFTYSLELKSRKWDLFKKNLFAGNTTFMKKDYISVGGMDESFKGYGFADNDMTYNVFNKGMKAFWMDAFEIHLYHKKEVMKENKMLEWKEYKKISEANMQKFLKKWKLDGYQEYTKLFL